MDDPPLSMSVNLSARQLEDPQLVHDVAHALEESSLDPSCLTLEITETVMMQDAKGAIDKLRELRSLGLNLAVDDLGTGYSSFNYLRSFPINLLKIDKSFVDRMDDTPEDGAVTAAIVHWPACWGCGRWREGIEEASQLERLVKMGCELGQGFLLARPLDRNCLEALLDDLHMPPHLATASA